MSILYQSCEEKGLSFSRHAMENGHVNSRISTFHKNFLNTPSHVAFFDENSDLSLNIRFAMDILNKKVIGRVLRIGPIGICDSRQSFRDIQYLLYTLQVWRGEIRPAKYLNAQKTDKKGNRYSFKPNRHISRVRNWAKPNNNTNGLKTWTEGPMKFMDLKHGEN